MARDDRLVPDVFADAIYEHVTKANPYRRFAEVRIPRSRRQRLVGRIRLATWHWRYRLAHAIYPFVEDGDD